MTIANHLLLSHVVIPSIFGYVMGTVFIPTPFVVLDDRNRDANFVVVSASVASISLSLLEHQAQSRFEDETPEEAGTEEEPESISVPVHGLGTVNILSVPVETR